MGTFKIPFIGLAQVTSGEDRTRLMAWYNLFGCFSSAIGALCCGGIIVYLNSTQGFGLLISYRLTMVIYATIKVSLEDISIINISGTLPPI